MNNPIYIYGAQSRKKKIPESKVGEFTSREKRNKQAMETKKAHFSFGSHNGKDFSLTTAISKKSSQQEMYAAHTIDIDSGELKRLQKQIKQTHFSFGGGRFSAETTSGQQYKQKVVEQNNVASDKRDELRKANFQFGNDNSKMQTTNQEQQQEGRVGSAFVKRPTESNFLKGSNNVLVRSVNSTSFKTSHQKDYPSYDLTVSMAARKEAQDTGKNVRKSHLELGNDKQMFEQRSSSQKEFKFYRPQIPKSQSSIQTSAISPQIRSRVQTQRDSSIKLGCQTVENEFKTSTQLQQTPNKEALPLYKVTKDKVNEIRSLHFQMGMNEPANYQSIYNQNHPSLKVNKNFAQGNKFASSMRKENFSIGDKNSNEQVITTYTQEVSNKYDPTASKAIINTSELRSSNIKLGEQGGVNQYQSESKQMYNQKPNSGPTSAQNKALEQNIKASHLNFGSTKVDYATVNKSSHSYLGAQARDFPALNMQMTSFALGSYSQQFQNKGKTDRPMSDAQNVTKYLPRQQQSARKDHINIGSGNAKGEEFNTIQRSQYQWIQPKNS